MKLLRGSLLTLLVFVSGATVMAAEMCANRLLAPYFGTSLIIWANLIGLILIYLTVGYAVGGRLADRFPRPSALYRVTTVAALCIVLIPIVSRPLLEWSVLGFANYSAGIFFGSLFSVIFLFAIPLTLLGTVSPWAVRLFVKDVSGAGSTAGRLYALSTVGSIAGTFLPVLLMIPSIGTRATIWVFGFALLATSLAGLAAELGRKALVYATSLLAAVALVLWFRGGEIRAAGEGRLLFEDESLYNFIRVTKTPDGWTHLILNEGLAVHSLYNPHRLLTGGEWDYFLLAPLFRPEGLSRPVKDVLVIGLGGGTTPREYSVVYPRARIDGVEIDGEIVRVGRRYFGMNEPQLHVTVDDGRYFLLTTHRKYDVICIDAYQQPYIPFYMTTREFFELARQHLKPGGVVAINVGRAPGDFRLVNALSNTMASVYPSVFVVDTKEYLNSLVYATTEPMTTGRYEANAQEVTNPYLREVVSWANESGNIRRAYETHPPMTDDLAPVERLIDNMIVDYALKRSKP